MNTENYIAAFITGHSVRGCTGLSEEQLAFQRRSAIPEEKWLRWNFPYHATYAFPEDFQLLAASFNNVGHFLYSQRPAFRQRHGDAVAELFAKYDLIILLATSCGLELLRNLQLPNDILQRVHVFACGPVSLGMPNVATSFMIQGQHDFISRAFHRRVQRRFPCSHMGYLLAPETLNEFNEFCRRTIRATASST